MYGFDRYKRRKEKEAQEKAGVLISPEHTQAASNPDELLALIWRCEVVEKVFDSGYCVRDVCDELSLGKL
ncbi:hypothetical protein EMVG_00323 [Emiliania huxleyi virus PS401]|nr:hypothetical protein EMVG_00323 [Emiliania huxleyi virus PS401]